MISMLKEKVISICYIKTFCVKKLKKNALELIQKIL